jgi:hypothetical protein
MSDRDTKDMFGEVAYVLAKLYKRHIYPDKYDKVIYQDNMRIRLRVEPYTSKDDTQPVFGVRDEDDRIAD